MQPNQHRETARVLLYRRNNQLLLEFFLLKTHFDPEVKLPPRWITPGGGIDPGEDVLAAAIRELHEETGLRIASDDLGRLVWQTSGKWFWGDLVNHHSYTDYFFKLKIETFDLDNSLWTADEHRDVIEHRWWTLQELIETGEQIGPPGLVEFLANHAFN